MSKTFVIRAANLFMGRANCQNLLMHISGHFLTDPVNSIDNQFDKVIY